MLVAANSTMTKMSDLAGRTVILGGNPMQNLNTQVPGGRERGGRGRTLPTSRVHSRP